MHDGQSVPFVPTIFTAASWGELTDVLLINEMQFPTSHWCGYSRVPTLYSTPSNTNMGLAPPRWAK